MILNAPETPEGAACLSAAQAALAGGGMEQPRVDMAGALALTTAQGVAADIAAELLRYAAEGIAIGLAERREGAE